ncbi:MAG: DUF4349 domain-containing protein [Lachnospiraceae bacterium]|nr:DUF4349 domain-containing protein [Lachnospiraceae bacterium]
MKKKDLFKKLCVIASVIAMSASLAACSKSNSASTAYEYDYKDYSAGDTPMMADAAAPAYEADYDYYDEEYASEDNGGFGGDTGSQPINETQANASVAKNRKLIKTVNLTIETVNYDATIADLENKIAAIGGYIENQYSYNGSAYNNSQKNKYATITVRIPDTALDSFVKDVAGVGNITEKTTSTQDVTLNYVDTESKKEMYLAEQESLLGLLEKAETIEDITYLTQRLTEIRYNIESMESSLRVYDDLVAYATVNFTINEVQVLTPTVVVEKTPAEELKEGFENSLSDVLIGTRDFFINLVINLPYIIRGLICLAIPVLIIFIVIRIIIVTVKKKNAKKSKDFTDRLHEDNILEKAAKSEDKKEEKAEDKKEEKAEDKKETK